ncbi:ShlB/FhaC/HecB family hemolysin secretion/activation protein [Marinobacter halodurans]|uniref:ShlB/FhaC/HecB family hemolysin secretion/activation protein n=1 Tax=Marinobacter halodurans TaxID=2528979 RepID=UPI001F61148D|nr:ShlB/FhaC/HecB family hemolysin secretion/activation protein [Marinobacter halodurans]
MALMVFVGCLISAPSGAVVRFASPSTDNATRLSSALDASFSNQQPVSGWLTPAPHAATRPDRAQLQTDWPSGRCVPIDSVRMPGLRLLSSRVVTRVQALVQPETRQCLDPERLNGLASRINRVLEEEGEQDTIAWLPERPIVDHVLTLRFRNAAMGETRKDIARSGPSATAHFSSRGTALVASDALPSYTFGRWSRPAGLADVAPVEGGNTASADSPKAPTVRFQHVHRHWLGSHLQLAGNSASSRDQRSGQIGLEADNLIRDDHALRLNFNESESQRIENEAEAFSFHYAFPLGLNRFSFDVDNFSYRSTVIGDEGKYDASGEGRNIHVSGQRALFSLYGVQFDSVMSLSTRDASYYEDGEWVEDSSRQKSRFTLQGSTSHELWYDVIATTQVSAVSGLEMVGKEYDMEEDFNEDEAFSKYSLSAALSRDFFSWRWGLSGHYQFSPNDLPDSEYLTVAGSSLISGFNGQSVSASQGGWLRLDASSPHFDMPLMPYLRSGLNFSLLRGWVPYTEAQADRYGSASAAEISLSMQGQGFQAGLSVGRMLGASSLATTKPDVPDVSLSLSMGL